VIKTRILRRAGNLEHMGKRELQTGDLVEKTEENRQPGRRWS
jgi:hypothetical protein